MNNVIPINRGVEFPNDLMSFKEIQEKYNLKYGFLYKWVVTMKKIPAHYRGHIAISEKDLLLFLEEKGKKWRV